MPYLTMTKKTKATTKPLFNRLLRHPARKRSGSILGQHTHTHTHLLTYLLSPDPHGENGLEKICRIITNTASHCPILLKFGTMVELAS